MQAARFLRLVFACVFWTALVALSPRIASAQAAECASNGVTSMGASVNSDASEFWSWGEVDLGISCGGTKRIELWINGISGGQVCTGSTWDPTLGSCVGTGSGQGLANSFAKAQSNAPRTPYFFSGWWEGRANFWYIDNNTWYRVGPSKSAGAQGASPPPPVDCNDPANQNLSECGSPIVIPLNPNGRIRLTSLEDGVHFDLNADGTPERTAWTDPRAAVAFLALDRNGNGRIDDGSELFGDHTLPGVTNGFAALAILAHEGVPQDQWDGVVDTEPLFARLLLWHDLNHNGVSEPNELIPASQILTGIGLGYSPNRFRDHFGNLFAFRGFAFFVDGVQRNIFDVFFRTDSTTP
jgi:hypothetical protein